MTPKAFRSFALSLPDAHEEPHFDRASFRVGKKIFATMTADGKEAMVKVGSIDRIDTLLKSFPAAFFDYGGWTWKGGALGVRLAEVDPELLRELVTAAHGNIAARTPSRARAAARPARKKPQRRR